MTRRSPAFLYPAPWQAFLFVVAAAAVAYFALPLEARDGVFAIVGVATPLAVLAGAYAHRARPLLPWLLLAAGRLVLFLGDVATANAVESGQSGPFPSVADSLYMVGFAALIVGFVLLLGRRTIMPDWHLLLDAGVFTAGLGLLAWVALVDPLLADPAVAAAERARDVVFSLADLVLVFAVATLFFAPGSGRPSMRLFALSMLALVVADAMLAYLAPHQPMGGPCDVAYLLSQALFGAAALHPSAVKAPAVRRRRDHRLTNGRLLALSAASLIAPIVLITAGSARAVIDYWVIGVGWMAIVGLVVACVFELVREQAATLEQQLKLERELRETSSRLGAIVDASPLPIIAMDERSRVIFWSRGAELLYGYTADEVVGGYPPVVPDGGRDELSELIAPALRGELAVSGEMVRRTKSGDTIEVRAHVGPMRDAEGRIGAVVAIHEDLRERKQLEAELFEARKMESVGRLAGGVAHDFNNILTAIIGFADLSIAEPPGSDLSENLVAIKNSAERAASLTQQLLAFSRRQMLQPQVVELNATVLGMEPMLRGMVGEDIALRIVTTPNVGCIRADPSQLEQVILNLALNARDAMADGGDLTITTSRRSVGASRTVRPQIDPGDYVVLTVSDSGCGMDEETKAHIFEPFFTTREQGRGMGLGLATTYGIVRQSGGHIAVDTAPGAGTTFVIYFPMTSDIPARPVMEEAPAAERRGRILLVEDEPVLRGLASRVLRRAGFEVLAAEDPIQAMAMTDAQPADGIDLLLTDVVMPGMRGPELARRMRARRADLRVLLTSGYAEEIVESEAIHAGFLAKPFTPDMLVLAVDEALRPADL